MNQTSPVPTRPLGPNSPAVPVFSLGSWNIWDRIGLEASTALVARAAELGAAFFDVAHYNMGPHAENATTDLIFGRAVAEAGLRREDYTLCGKLWLWEYPQTSFAEQMQRSLERMDVAKADHVVVGDYFGQVDARRIVEDAAAEIEAGRFDSWGVNNWGIEELRTALDHAAKHNLTPPTFAQLKYSLVRRSMAEGDFYGPLFEQGILGLQASDVLEGGILAGKLFPTRKIGADVGDIRAGIVAAYPEAARVAEGYGATPTQLALAFTLSNPATSNVLFGASSIAQLEENIGALEVLERIGAERIREDTRGLWLDTAVNPDGTWPAG
ncbi:aldo/keto reductase [Paeniglutamicibacter sp. R2-26]|uniref:aldo/keto reductase n=1 Tax=Paeniglutamicibacter sp. R2-26 TaxID=3144417 RepID=UPI003EE70A7A